MNNLELATIIKNNIGLKNLEGNRDIVIYDNASGANPVEDIALEMGATYEMFITSAYNTSIMAEQCGQQKITIKLIPSQPVLNSYDLYMPIHFFRVFENDVGSTVIHIYNYDIELWNIDIADSYVKIYKIIKKAV